MSKEELKKEIFSIKKEADEELNKKNYDKAISQYNDIIFKIKELEINKVNFSDEEKNSFTNELIIPSNLNLSFIYFKKNEWKYVILHSTNVLNINQNNIKAKYRRCIANLNLNELDKAKEDLNDLKNKIGNNTELKILQQMYIDKEKQVNENEGKRYKKMFKNLSKINHDIEYEKKSNFGKKIDDISTGISSIWDNIKYIICFCCKKKTNSKKYKDKIT